MGRARSWALAPATRPVSPAKFAHFVLRTGQIDKLAEWYRIVLNARADWRWGEAATTPWYPTARLFRAERGDWVMAVLLAIADL